MRRIPAAHSDRWGITKYLSNGRVGRARLRGEPSFGVIVDRNDPDCEEGKDVQNVFGITKYVPPVQINAAYGTNYAGLADVVRPVWERNDPKVGRMCL